MNLTENEIKEKFVTEYNKLINNKKEVTENLILLIKNIDKRSTMHKKIGELEAQIIKASEMSETLVKNSSTNYKEKYDELIYEYDQLVEQLNVEKKKLKYCEYQLNTIEVLIKLIKRNEYRQEWDKKYLISLLKIS